MGQLHNFAALAHSWNDNGGSSARAFGEVEFILSLAILSKVCCSPK